MALLESVKVELGLGSAPFSTSITWTDVTRYVLYAPGISTRPRGRIDEFTQAQAATCTLTFNNSDGRFTAGYTGGAYYPNIKLRVKVRVSVQSQVTPGTWIRLFTGYIDDWPVEWPAVVPTFATATVTAVDRFKALNALREFASPMQQEYLYDTPFAYYTLGDASGASACGDVSGLSRNSLAPIHTGTGGTYEFGSATGPAKDGQTALALTPVDSTDGYYFGGLLGASTAAGSDMTVEAWFSTTSTASMWIAAAEYSGAASGGLPSLGMYVDGTNGHLSGVAGVNASLTGGTSVRDGLTHHAVMTHSISGSTATVTLYLDGTSIASTTYAVTTPNKLWFDSLYIGGRLFGQPIFSGTIAHVAVYNSALSSTRVGVHNTGGTTGFSGERSDQRIARYLRWAGVDSSEYSLETGMSTSIAFVDTTGTSPLKAMQDITDTENGVLFVNGAGVVTFQARSHRYNASSGFTFDGVLDPGVAFELNDVYTRNTVTCDRPGGISHRVVNSGSVTDYGPIIENRTLLTTSDAEVVSAANWLANQYATPTPRIGTLSVNLSRPDLSNAQRDAILGLEVGSLVTIASLPTSALASSVNLFIESVSYQLEPGNFQVIFSTSPAATGSVWVLGSSVYSVLGSTTTLAY